jgi:hypothetical protein
MIHQVPLHAGIVQGTAPKLFHNLGGGKFQDVTAKAGCPREQVARRGGLRFQQ